MHLLSKEQNIKDPLLVIFQDTCSYLGLYQWINLAVICHPSQNALTITIKNPTNSEKS